MNDATPQAADFEPLTAEVEVNPPEAFARALFDYALDRRATDIFISDDTDATVVKIRQLGTLRPMRRLTRDYGRRLQNHIRALANADVTDHQHPATGRCLVLLDDKRMVDLRINSIPSLFGQEVALRLFEHGRSTLQLNQLGLLRDELDELRRLLDAPSGLILLAGPTGSGKTHTMYSFLDYLNNGRRKIHTLEDPVEFVMPGVVQSQVNSRAGIDFASLLHAALRHSPDVIMIGEIRDKATAEIAIRAAGSGQLVLATVHAQDAVGAIQSMLAYDGAPQFLASTLLGVVSQCLLRRLCPACHRAIQLPKSSNLLSDLRERYQNMGEPHLYAPAGCPACDDQGYDRLICVPEILVASQRIRQGISDGYSAHQLQQLALQAGMRTLSEACKIRIALGMATAEDAYEALPADVDTGMGLRMEMPDAPRGIKDQSLGEEAHLRIDMAAENQTAERQAVLHRMSEGKG
ncbi:GspE/PulE family protein [Planctomycetaceae bacterium SH139]